MRMRSVRSRGVDVSGFTWRGERVVHTHALRHTDLDARRTTLRLKRLLLLLLLLGRLRRP